MSSRPLLVVPARSPALDRRGNTQAMPVPLRALTAAAPAAEPRSARTTPRYAKAIARVLVLLLAVSAPGLAFAGQKSVTIDVDGRVRTVRTYASNAKELLTRTGLRISADDMVTPAGPLRSGTRVTFRRAKPITLLVDGKPTSVITHGLTVREGLASLGLKPTTNDYVFPPGPARLARGMSVSVRNAIHTKVRVDGRLRDVVSAGATVSELLRQAGISVGRNDYVVPDPSGKPVDGMWIRVVRVRRIVTESHRAVPFDVVIRRDARLASGVRRVVQAGAEGLEVRKTLVVTEDGSEVSRSVLSVSTIRPAKNRIVKIGTREPRFYGSGHSQSGLASWFRADGLVAAHPSLPMGTVVRVTNTANGKSVNVRIADRGPYVDGRIIDLSDSAFARLASLGSGTIRVKVSW